MERTRMHFTLDKSLKDAISRESKKESRTMGSFIEWVVKKYLNSVKEDTTENQTAK